MGVGEVTGRVLDHSGRRLVTRAVRPAVRQTIHLRRSVSLCDVDYGKIYDLSYRQAIRVFFYLSFMRDVYLFGRRVTCHVNLQTR